MPQTKERHTEYMRERRAQARKTTEQHKAKLEEATKAKIEEMTERSFDELQVKWCVDATARSFRQMHPDWSTEQVAEAARTHCAESKQVVHNLIATDLAEAESQQQVIKAEIADTIETVVNSNPFTEEITRGYEDTVNYCIKTRTHYLGSLYNSDAIQQYCRNLLPKLNQLVRTSLLRQEMREAGKYPSGDVSQEYADRVYSLQAILDVPQATVERHVKADMINEGKFADLSKRSYNPITVGDLFGKTRKQIIAETFPEQTHYGKDAKAREEFQKFEDEQREKGVRIPSPIQTPSPSKRSTVGNLYGKTRKEIQDMNKEKDEK